MLVAGGLPALPLMRLGGAYLWQAWPCPEATEEEASRWWGVGAAGSWMSPGRVPGCLWGVGPYQEPQGLPCWLQGGGQLAQSRTGECVGCSWLTQSPAPCSDILRLLPEGLLWPDAQHSDGYL